MNRSLSSRENIFFFPKREFSARIENWNTHLNEDRVLIKCWGWLSHIQLTNHGRWGCIIELIIFKLVKRIYISLWNCSHVKATRSHWWSVNTSSSNGLEPSGTKPLPELMLTLISVTISTVQRKHWSANKFNIKMSYHQSRNCHYKGKTVMRESQLYSGSPYTRKDCLCVEMGPMWLYQTSDCLSKVWGFPC